MTQLWSVERAQHARNAYLFQAIGSTKSLSPEQQKFRKEVFAVQDLEKLLKREAYLRSKTAREWLGDQAEWMLHIVTAQADCIARLSSVKKS